LIVVWTVVTVVFSIFDFFVYGKGMDMFNRFQSTTGKVISVYVDSLPISRRPRGTYGVSEYRRKPYVLYEFEMNGKKERRARLFLFDHPMMSDPEVVNEFLQEIVNRYQPGQAVTVHFSPSDSDVVFLEVGWPYLAKAARAALVLWLPGVLLFGLAWPLQYLVRTFEHRSAK
jgi:hypothetical protein